MVVVVVMVVRFRLGELACAACVVRARNRREGIGGGRNPLVDRRFLLQEPRKMPWEKWVRQTLEPGPWRPGSAHF